MKFKLILAAFLAVALPCAAHAQATLLPPGEQCFQATTGLNGMLGTLGTITGGSSYVPGVYGGVALTGGSGSGGTANITVGAGGSVTSITVLNPGVQFVVGDVISAAASSIGGSGSGFSIPVLSTSINSSLAGGSVSYLVPGTQSVKQTWQDSAQTTLNQNPVALDANGCATVFGVGIYRQILQDSLGNTVWDRLTASTSPIGIYWAGQSGGTGNAITIVDTSFALQDGAAIQFLASAQNSGPATIAVSGGTQIAIVVDTGTGPAALSGGEIGPGNTPIITYDATNVEFHLVNPAASTSSSGGSSSLVAPQGYLNLVGQSSGVIQSGDVIGTGTIFYSPYVGDTLPIWNGSTFKTIVFSELTATLTTAGSPTGAIQDACVFYNNGTPTLVIGPAWSTATAGAGNRGAGPGSAQIGKLQGIWVNSNSITAYNGLSSFTVPSNQCTYVGSISIDATAGQVSAYRTWGQSRKFGIWNAYNRAPISIQAGDSTANWTTAPTTWRQSNGATGNFAAAFTGLPEEIVTATFIQQLQNLVTDSVAEASIGIGVNSTTVLTGTAGSNQLNSSITLGAIRFYSNAIAQATVAPTLGISQLNMIEQAPVGTTNNTFYGTAPNMVLTVNYRG